MIVVNKWDTIPNKNQQTATYYEQDVREKLRVLDWAPIVYSTAIAGHSVEKYVLTYIFFHYIDQPAINLHKVLDSC